MSSGKLDRSLCGYVKVVEVIPPKNPSVQVNRTIIMNSHRIWFPGIIVVVKLKSVHNPNGNLSWSPVNHKVREIFLRWEISGGQKMFLSVTKIWVSDAWQDTFVLKFQK